MIIRTNLNSPDFVINHKDSLKTRLNNLIRLATDPTSKFFIDSEYILYRLVDCAKNSLHKENNPLFCPITFDSWSCWNATPPNSTQFTHCPNFVNLGFRPERLASKECREDGTWWVHPATNRLVQYVKVCHRIYHVTLTEPGPTTKVAWTIKM